MRLTTRTTTALIAMASALALVTSCASSGQPADSGTSQSGESATGNASEPDGAHGDYEEGPLVVMGSSPDVNETYQQNLDRLFKEETGATIKWMPGAAPKALTKLIASKGGTPPADVVMLDSPTQTVAVQAGVLEKLDPAKLVKSGPHLPESVWPNPGYGPAAKVLRMGTCYNTEQIKAHNISLTHSIDDWFNPDLKGHFTFPDVGTYYTNAMLPVIAKNYGVSFDSPNELLDKIADAQPAQFWTSTADVQQNLQSGETWLTPIHDARCLNLKLQGDPVEFDPLNLKIDGKTYPYDGLFDTWDIAKGTSKPNLAAAFIDLALTSEAMLPVTKKFAYLPSRSDVLEQAKKDPELTGLIGDFTLDQLYVPPYRDWQWFDKYQDVWNDAWTERFK